MARASASSTAPRGKPVEHRHHCRLQRGRRYDPARERDLHGHCAHRIVYETDTGELFHDSNGSAAGGDVQFAQLAAGLGLSNLDFLVV